MKKIVLLTVLFLSIVSTASSSEILNKKEFTKKYTTVLVNLYPDAKIKLAGDLEVRITMPGDNELTAFLHNAYNDYQNTPGDIENILNTYAGSLTLSKDLENKKFGKERIFPVIKDKEYIRQIEEMTKGSKTKRLVYEKLNDVLYVLYAFDTPKAISFLTEKDLAEVGVEKSELRKLAKANLKKAVPKLQLEGNPAELSMLVADGMYEASFILFDSIWTKKQFPVKGDIVVYIPTRDFVLITGSKDKVNLAKVHNIVYKPKNPWSHVVAEVGFIRVNGSWRVYQR